jgi:hypothetical protein
MPFKLTVPFEDKEEAKKLGAWWSHRLKSWVVPDHIIDVTLFQKWIPLSEGFIIRKPYRIASTQRNCWKCKIVTPMVALASSFYFEFTYMDEDDPDCEMEWNFGPYSTVFCNVTQMSEHVSEMLKRDFPFYRPTWSKTQKQQTWANNCIHCGSLQGEWHNHEDFDGAFFPDPFEKPRFPIELKAFDLELDYHIIAEYGNLDNDILVMAERALNNKK